MPRVPGGNAVYALEHVLLFLGFPFAVTLATHEVASVALGIGATIRHLREEPLEHRLVTHILFFGLPGVIVGNSVILSVPERDAEVALGLLTAGLGIYSLISGTGLIVTIWLVYWFGLDYRRAIAESNVPLSW